MKHCNNIASVKVVDHSTVSEVGILISEEALKHFKIPVYTTAAIEEMYKLHIDFSL